MLYPCVRWVAESVVIHDTETARRIPSAAARRRHWRLDGLLREGGTVQAAYRQATD